MLWIRNDLFLIRIQLRFFRVPDPDPDVDPAHFIEANLEIFEKHTLYSLKNKTLPTICHFLLHTYGTTILQYTQSRIQRTKLKNEIPVFIYLLLHFLLDPELEH